MNLPDYQQSERLSRSNGSRLSWQDRKRIEELCTEFESAWQKHTRPQIEAYLRRAPTSCQGKLFAELLALEVDYRKLRGETADREEYLARFPATLVEEAFYKVACPDGAINDDPIESAAGRGAEAEVNDTNIHEVSHTRNVVHFRLDSRVGSGQFGEVWKAYDTKLDRLVALKIPRRTLLTAVDKEAFLREARAAARLHHPCIVATYETGADGDTLYIATEFIEGSDLKQHLDGQALDARKAAGLCSKLAEALHYAHEAGVVHRDLKSANILIDESGTPHIADFGLAKSDSEVLGLTVDGQPLGTPAYMPPEQARGKGRDADGRADVYSLGVILFECLTGTVPFHGDLHAIIDQILHDEPPSPKKLNHAVPGDLEVVCLKCLEKAPNRRYQTAAEVRDELERWQRGEPICARPVTNFDRGIRWILRNPGISVASCIAASLLVILSVVSTVAYVRTSRALRRETIALDNETLHRKISERNVYIAQMNLVEGHWKAGNTGRAADLLQDLLPEGGEEDLRGFEWYYYWHLCNRQTATFDHNEPISWLSFSPDGKTLATAGNDGTFKFWDTSAGTLLFTLPGPEHEAAGRSVEFSPDGRTFATAQANGRISLFDAATYGRIKVLESESEKVRSVRYSPNGQTIASAHNSPNVAILWNVAKRSREATLSDHADGVNILAFSADGQLLATGSRDTTARIWSVSDGSCLATLEGHAKAIYSVCFSLDSKQLATTGIDRTIKLWEVNGGDELLTMEGHADTVTSVAFFSNRVLASGSEDGTIKLWDVDSGDAMTTLTGHRGQIRAIAVSPNGKTVASCGSDGTARLWDPFAPAAKLVMDAHKDTVWDVRFSPNGKILASCSSDGVVRIWNAATFKTIHLLTGHTADVDAISFSPDGSLLASASDDKTIRLWNVQSGTNEGVIHGQKDFVNDVTFSPSGEMVASGCRDGTVSVYNVGSRQLATSLKAYADPSGVTTIDFSSDGTLLASGGRKGEFTLWDVQSWLPRTAVRAHLGKTLCVVFSPDGRFVASGGGDGMVNISVVGAEDNLFSLQADVQNVRSVAFSPDGRSVATGGADGSVRMWDLVNGRQRASFDAENGEVYSVVFSPDGKTIAAGTDLGAIVIWRCEDPIGNEH